MPKVNIPSVANTVISRIIHTADHVFHVFACRERWERGIAGEGGWVWGAPGRAETQRTAGDNREASTPSLAAREKGRRDESSKQAVNGAAGSEIIPLSASGATSVAEHCCGANPPRED